MLTLFVSVYYVPTVNAAFSKNVYSYTGEQIFKGIIFGKGEFANNVPLIQKMIEKKISKLSSSEKLVFSKLQDEIYEKFVHDDPNFINTFKEEILSHDYIKIDNALKKTGDKLTTYLKNRSIKTNNSNTADNGSCVTITAFVNIAVVVEIVVLVLAVAVAYTDPTQQDLVKTKLQREQIVDCIAKL